MRSPAAAVLWEFRHRHRWGFAALGVYFLVLAVIKLLVLRGKAVVFDDPESFAVAIVVPMTATYIYFLGVFTFGLSGDIAARESMYPARMFAMPVSTSGLAWWPMLYGTLAITVLWFATRLLAIWPAGEKVAIIWPAVVAASMLAWAQALTWMSYPLRGLRVIVTVFLLASIDAVAMAALNFKPPETVMVAIAIPHLPLAYLVARFAVARARRGDVPDWRLGFAETAGKRKDFRSSASAQTWLEWRRYGRSLPALVAILLPFELALLFIFREVPVIIIEMVVSAMLTPPLMAFFVAATVSKSSRGNTLPMTDASLIAAKLKAALWSTLAAWLLVLAAVPLALRLSGTAPVIIDAGRLLIEIFGRPRAIAIVLTGLLLLIASTWKQLVQSLFIGLTGREWIAKASVFATLAFISIFVPAAHWAFTNTAPRTVLWNAFPWILAALVCLKAFAAAWTAIRLHDRRLISDRTLITGIAVWNAVVFALFGFLTWIFPGVILHSYMQAFIAILAVPLARLLAAPLALAWNRHR